MPFLDADEMANTPIGPYPPHSGGFSPLVVAKLQFRPYTPLFLEVFGFGAFESAPADIYAMATMAIAAFEGSAEVDQFSSKFDASRFGYNFVDYGLGGNPNPSPGGQQFMQRQPGDIGAFRGLFKAPSVRNVDKRPGPKFVRAYMHNAVFKSLEEVVHFYNKRNIAVNGRGDEIAFDLRSGPPSGYTRLLPAPEVIDNVQNVAGVTPAEATADTASNGQVGHLELTAQEEADLVSFLRTLTDGYTKPNPVSSD